MKINQIIASTKDNVLLDSENSPLFVGDIIAYCNSKERGGGYLVKKDIIKEIIKETGKVRLLSNKALVRAKYVLKISGIVSEKELSKNEENIKNIIDKEKEQEKIKRKTRIAFKYCFIAYSENGNKVLESVKICSKPGKSIVKDDIFNILKSLTHENLHVLTTNSEFEKYNDYISPVTLTYNKVPYCLCHQNPKLINCTYDPKAPDSEDKRLMTNYINQYKNKWYTSTEKDIINAILKNDKNALYHCGSFFKYTYNSRSEMYVFQAPFFMGSSGIDFEKFLRSFYAI